LQYAVTVEEEEEGTFLLRGLHCDQHSD
jgi:hypothetical protein